jgi:hypothetical protein
MCKKFVCLVSAFLVAALICPAVAQDMEIAVAPQPPVINGEVDDIWMNASVQNMVPLDPASASASWQALYDADNLYVIVDVTDDALVNDSASSWQDDSVEFYFDGDNSKDGPPLSGDNRQYTFGWTTDEVQGTNAVTEGVEHAQVDTAAGWRIEMKLPWLSLRDVEPMAGDLIGIDCFYNDDDDGGDTREAQIFTFAGDGSAWSDAAQWGTAVLAGQAVTDTLTGLSDVTVVDGAIESLRHDGTEYVVADGDLMLGTTTRWYVLDGVETLWAEGEPAPQATVSGTSSPKEGDVGSKADNFLFTLDGGTSISSIDGIDFQETIFPALSDTFFLFERGGNDTGTWQAIFADGSLADPVPFSGAEDYANTGVSVSGQDAYGVVFKTAEPVQGVRITASGHDTLSISIPAPPPEPVAPGTEGLVAFYPLDGDANDVSGNGLNGTIVGDPNFVEGKIGMALDFDGADDVVELGMFDIEGQITLAAWIKPDDFEINDARIISKAQEWGGNDHWWMLSTISETSLRFRLKTDDGQDTATLVSDPVLEAGVFTHVAATWDGSMMRIYADGAEIASMEKGGTAVAVDPNISAAIGSQPSDAFASDPSHVAKFFDGLIDEVTIYNRALSEAEVRYLAGFRPTPAAAFAFGARDLDCPTFNNPDVSYTMVLHESPEAVQYDPERGYGYEVLYPADSPYGDRSGYGMFGPFDDSPNSRNEFPDECPEELYDSFIGAKNFLDECNADIMGDSDTPCDPPEGIIFRVDVPNGFYRFVGAFGEADNLHAHRILAEDGGSGPPENIGSNHVVLVNNHDQAQYAIGEAGEDDDPGDGVFARVGFDGMIPPPGDGVFPSPQFIDMDSNGMPTDAGPDSPVLEVTQGYIRIHQLQGNSNNGPGGEHDANGGDIVILELWEVEPPANILENGGFEAGVVEPWNTYGNVTAEVVSELADAAVPEAPVEGDSCLHVVVPEAGANFWDAGLQHAGHVFEAGKKYTLSAWLKSKSGTLDINFKPEIGQDPWTGYGSQAFTMTEEWAEYRVTTPVFETDVSPATITFHIAYAPGEFWVDNVRFYEVD